MIKKIFKLSKCKLTASSWIKWSIFHSEEVTLLKENLKLVKDLLSSKDTISKFKNSMQATSYNVTRSSESSDQAVSLMSSWEWKEKTSLRKNWLDQQFWLSMEETSFTQFMTSTSIKLQMIHSIYDLRRKTFLT